MARARNIKPALFDNDELAENDPLGRLLFIGMWTIADFKGDFVWREKRIKAKLLPYDNCDIKKLAINLDKSGFIRFYSDGDEVYCNVTTFNDHQNPHKNEKLKGSDIPAYSEDMRQAVDLKGLTINHDKSGLEQEYSHSDRADSLILNPDSLSLNPDSLSLNPETLNPESPSAQSASPSVDNVIFDYWLLVMKKPSNTIFNQKRKSAVKARLKEGYTEDQIKDAIDGCSKTPHNMGQNDQSKKFDDLELICRNGCNVDRFIGNLQRVIPVDNKPDYSNVINQANLSQESQGNNQLTIEADF